MPKLLIANILSFITACFTLASSWTTSPKRTYGYQVAQCLVYSAAAYFFGVYACIFMMLINAARNYLVAVGRYNGRLCGLFAVLALVLGLAVNQRGIIGLLTVIATVEYTVLSYFLKEARAVKLNVIINLLIWLCYDILVVDVFSASMDGFSTVLAVIAIVRIMREGRKNNEIIGTEESGC